MKNYTKELFIQKLNEIQFPDYSIFENVNEAYSDFVTKFMSVIDSICPLRQVRIKTNTKPWFDGNILEAIRVRDKLRKKYKKSGLQVDFEMFKDTQKNAKQLTKMKKCTYVKALGGGNALFHKSFSFSYYQIALYKGFPTSPRSSTSDERFKSCDR
jgi:hypothetical protein